jgi:excisionase family DNA binding protein
MESLKLDEDRLLTIRQAMARLALGKTKIDRFVASGTLKSLKIGRARRIPASEVAPFIREGASL